jgi:undecaprenyl-diphosphatase
VIPGILAVGVILYLGSRRLRLTLLAALLALLVSDIGSEKVIKNFFGELRPYVTLDQVHVFRGGDWMTYQHEWYALDSRKSHAFPSSHAANATAFAVVLGMQAPATLCVTVPLALLVGFSRVYTGHHYPDDVLGGWIWGALCGFVMVLLVRRAAARWLGPDRESAWNPPREHRIFLWVLGGWTAFNFLFLYLNLFGLAADEAQYWDWSRHLALGYYSKPPMIAYVMHLLTSAGGSQAWALRSGAVILTSGAIALVHALTLRITKNEKAALLAGLAALAAPSTWAGSLLMTIDPLLAFFWALAMYAFYRAVNGDKWMWLLLGLALGLGMLSKYTMGLLYVSFGLYLILVDRRWWRTPWPYAALLISVLCLTGVVYWNWANDWVSIRHTAAIGEPEKHSIGRSLSSIGTFWGGQAGVVSPILFGFLLWAMWVCLRRFRANRDAAFLFLCFIVLFGFYALLGFERDVNVNWPVCAYLAAAVGFGWIWTERARGRAMRRLLTAGLILGCVIGLFARSTEFFYLAHLPLPSRIDPTSKLYGGPELGAALSKYVKDAKSGPFIFADRYQNTAYAAFYTKGHPRAYCMNTGSRRYNQYDLWGGWEALKGRDGILVVGGDAVKANLYIAGLTAAKAFDRGEVLETVDVFRGNKRISQYTLVRMHNYSGLTMQPEKESY